MPLSFLSFLLARRRRRRDRAPFGSQLPTTFFACESLQPFGASSSPASPFLLPLTARRDEGRRLRALRGDGQGAGGVLARGSSSIGGGGGGRQKRLKLLCSALQL